MLLLMGTASALASGLHFKSGPVWSTDGTTVTASGQVAGAGTSIDATVTVTVTATGCTNPGGNVAEPHTFSSTQSGDSGPIATNHGNATFNVSTPPPVAPAGTCPNGNWTIHYHFSPATLTINSTNGGSLTATHQF
jgi:hypothetical protein